MSASRLGRIEELFHEALARPAGERRAFVSEASDDTELVREVNALLEDHDSAAGYFQELTLKLADSATSELEGVASTGMVIGAYRTVRLLGRGGMGSVFLAERADGHYSQQVAVKLIRRGMDSEDLIRRFVSERQILARLNHPNIARLLDGGLSEDDRPYLILEYIEGTPLTTYCDDRHLDIDARLKLFIRVGRAVAYAHGSLVVHRDLKPSNIVVTRKGVVKLLDFGIAKILSEEGSEQRTHTVTVTGSRILTPEYAAPEQITGGAITTATDVYGLGVVLYELLTGSRPLTLTDGSLVELERRVLEQHPTRPSACVARSGKRDGVARKRSTNAKRLSRRLSGELDTICEMALRKEPERRYRSVERFIEDMERHQAGLPVSAQADTLGYRARKFVQRHSLGVAAVSAFAILVTGFGVVTAAQSARLVRERDKAEKVSELFVDLFRGYDSSEELLYLELDGTFLRYHQGAEKKEPILVATGYRIDGTRVLLHIGVGNGESYANWKGFLQEMVARGLREPLLIVTDGNPGVLKAIEEVFPQSLKQRCQKHRLENILGKAPKEIHDELKAEILESFHAKSYEQGLKKGREVITRYRQRFPSGRSRILMAMTWKAEQAQKEGATPEHDELDPEPEPPEITSEESQ